MSIFDNRRPFCPDPERYVWVDAKEGGYWRMKRGSKKKAVLNAQYQKGNELIKVSAPAASRVVRRLRASLEGLRPGRLTVRISGKLRTGLNETGKLDFTYLKGFDFQPDFPMKMLLQEPVFVEQKDGELVVTIAIHNYTIEKPGKLVTNYHFELIMIWGNLKSDNGLKIDSDISDLFSVGDRKKSKCRLSLPIPKGSWMAMLKVSCIEGNEMGLSPKNYGMRVVETG